MSLIKINHLSFRYQEDEPDILEDINLKIDSGEIVSVIGASGSGKTTLCYCLCGIIPHIYQGCMKGEVVLDTMLVSAVRLPVLSTRVGIVFQDPDAQLFSPTVEDEIAFGPENLCLDSKEIGDRIEESLRLVNISRHRFQHPENLSGGEKQLVAIASVLAMQPKVIIFDESLAPLDSRGRTRVKQVMSDLRDRGKTIILIDHDIRNLDLADRVFFLKQGKLEKIGLERTGDIAGLYRNG